MNLKIVFRIGAVINAINGLGLLFITQVFMEQAGFEITPPLLTIGQGMGVTFIFLAIIGLAPPILKMKLLQILPIK